MKRGFLLLLALINFLQADIRQEIADSLKKVAYDSNIDVRVLYTIAKTESDFKPFIISFLTDNKEMIDYLKNGFKDSVYSFRASKYDSNRYAVSISSEDKGAMLELSSFFWDFDFNIDFGLMQISKQNLTKDELEYIFEPEYNINKSKDVLLLCGSKYETAKEAIECYNKGFAKKQNYNYYAKFINHFNNFFGEEENR